MLTKNKDTRWTYEPGFWLSFTFWFSDRSEYFQSTTSSFSNGGGGSREKTELDDSPEFHSVNYPHYAEMFKVKKYYIIICVK